MSENLKQIINAFNKRLKDVEKTQKYKIYTSWFGTEPNFKKAGKNNTCSQGYTFIRDHNRDGFCLKCPSGKKFNHGTCGNKNRPFAIKKPSCPNNTTLIWNSTCADNNYKTLVKMGGIVTTLPSCPSGSTVHAFRGRYVCASCPPEYTGISQDGYCMTPSEVKNDKEFRNESVNYKSIKLANESFENVKKCEYNDYAPLLIFIILLLAVILCLKYNF
jgi:hypothetical protein